MTSILLVEDDHEIIKLLNMNLTIPSFRLSSCRYGEEALDKLSSEKFDLIILDIMLPGIDGVEVCKKIREKDDLTPILMLTSRSEELDKVLALELGADDYVTKPFGIKELIARIKALIRRSDTSDNRQVHQPSSITFRNITIESDKKKANISGKRLDLTPKEFDILLLLAANPGKTFSRVELLQQVWGYSFSGYEHTVTAHINRLRIKIEPDIDNPIYILTSWGTGYRFADENKEI
ncbi:MAG: response regulator transcription factor [Flavitalea sp.]